jgi:hypothetical protein
LSGQRSRKRRQRRMNNSIMNLLRGNVVARAGQLCWAFGQGDKCARLVHRVAKFRQSVVCSKSAQIHP